MEAQENQNFWNEAENELRKAGETTIVDFFKELLPSEYELEHIRHKQEHENILQKLKYRATIESKKKVLENELDLTIQYLEDEEEGEFRQIFGDLSQVTLDKMISKIKSISLLIQKTSLWHEMSHKEKTTFLTIKNLRSDLINENLPFREAYKELLKRLNIRLVIEQNKKTKPVTINRQLKDFVNRLFYDHFQVELNTKLQVELRAFLDPSELNMQVSNASSIATWKKDKVGFYQLIYALHSADYIDGEVTNIIETIAPNFGIELAKSWQTGLNQNINNNNSDYKPKIFEDMQKGYNSYLERRTSDKNKRNK